MGQGASQFIAPASRSFCTPNYGVGEPRRKAGEGLAGKWPTWEVASLDQHNKNSGASFGESSRNLAVLFPPPTSKEPLDHLGSHTFSSRPLDWLCWEGQETLREAEWLQDLNILLNSRKKFHTRAESLRSLFLVHADNSSPFFLGFKVEWGGVKKCSTLDVKCARYTTARRQHHPCCWSKCERGCWTTGLIQQVSSFALIYELK